MKRREPELLKAQEAKQKRDEEDRRLLAVFTTPEDAERARDRKLEALDLQISVDRGSVARLQADFDQTQAQAAKAQQQTQPQVEEVADE